MADDFSGPNGLDFSPDEQHLYVAECGPQFAADPPRYIRVFDVLGDGARLSEGRVFHTVSPGFADGFRVDEDGNIWSSAGDGVHCTAPDGTVLGRIKVPFTVSNLTFGGRNRARLFICASHTLFAIFTNQRAAHRP
jgi:gluconolactonase